MAFYNAYNFFVIEAEGFKFGVVGLLVAVFQQLKLYFLQASFKYYFSRRCPMSES